MILGYFFAATQLFFLARLLFMQTFDTFKFNTRYWITTLKKKIFKHLDLVVSFFSYILI